MNKMIKAELLAIFIIALGIIFYPLSADAKSYNIYIGKMPEHWKPTFGDVLDDATEWWEKRIPGIEFSQVEQLRHAHFVVQWASQPIEIEDGKIRLGYYTTNLKNDFGRPYIQITLGFFEDGKWNLVDSDYALEITKHELGHAIGIGHNNDPDDIMYPSLYDYQSWLDNKYSDDLNLSVGPTQEVIISYTHLSEELQELANSSVEQLKSSLHSKQDWLESMNFESIEANMELEKGLKSLDEAKEYLSNAESTQKEGEEFSSKKSWEQAYFKYLYSAKMVEEAWAPLAQVDSYIQTAQELEEEHQELSSQKIEPPPPPKEQKTQEKEKFCFLFWCW